MDLNNLTLEELFELRTNLILEDASRKEINKVSFLIDKMEKDYANSIKEDTSVSSSPSGVASGGGNCYAGGASGVGYANASNVAGMGAVIAAQPSSYAGSTIGSNFTKGGGTVGSGDLGFPLNATDGNKMYQKAPVMGKNHGPKTGKKSRKRQFDIKQFSGASRSKPHGKNIMSFGDFTKDAINKVTKVKN